MALAAVLGACAATPSPSVTAGPTVPSTVAADAGIPAVEAVVAAFANHSVVAIGELHGSAAQHAFVRSVVADERLAGLLDVIVVEFGSARHQRTIDRYLAGDEVPADELELVWTDTTQRSGVWDAPVYRQFYEFVRQLNARRDESDAVRVVLGDPPIEWDRITRLTDCDERDRTCLDYWLFRRGEHFARKVEAAVANGHHVLAIAGSGHIRRNPDIDHPVSTVDRLDAVLPGAVWSIVPIDAMSDEVRALTDAAGDGPTAFPLAGSQLGGLPFEAAFQRGTITCDPGPCETPGPPVPLASIADALLLP